MLGEISSPTRRFWGRSQRPEAKTETLSGNWEGELLTKRPPCPEFQKVMWSFHPPASPQTGPLQWTADPQELGAQAMCQAPPSSQAPRCLAPGVPSGNVHIISLNSQVREKMMIIRIFPRPQSGESGSESHSSWKWPRQDSNQRLISNHGPALVSVETGPRCLHSNPSSFSRCLVRMHCW